MPECSKRVILTVATGVFGFASFICLCVAVSTDYWLYALERYTEDHSGTNWTYKLTTTGLWRKCVELERDPEMKGKNCSYINYFKSQDKDGLGPTDAILLSLRRSTLFPLISLCILLAGQVIYVMSHCDRNRKVLTFVSGIVFVIAGLLILIGIILYIGAITEEAGNKSKSSMDKPRFEYWYGASFVFTITSFSTAEFTGVLSVYLYISRHKHSYRKKAERLHQNSFNQLQRHSRSAASLSNVTDCESKQRSVDSVSNAYNTRSPLQMRSNGRANGCIGMNVFGANPLTGETTAGNLLIGHQSLVNDASTASLPSYDQALFIDARRSEQPTSYQSVVEPCWPYAPMNQHNKPLSASSMVHSQWSGADLHPSASTTDYNYNDYIEDAEDVAYGESCSRNSQATQGIKVPKEQSRYTLSSATFDNVQNNPSSSEWYTPSHGRVLSTPDSNVYRRTTPV